MAALRGLRRMLCVLPLLVLAACSGIEKGDKIDHLQLVDLSSATPVALASGSQLLSYQCLRQQLGVHAVFGKNGSADYSLRPATTWTSSDPSVIRVSDGTDPDPSQPGRVFPKGVLTPLREGNAVITVDYVGIKANVNVIVREPDSIILSTSQFDTSADASASGPFYIAKGSFQQYHAYAKLRDLDDIVSYRDVTGNARWSSPNDADSSHVSISNPTAGLTSGGGLVTGVSPGGPYIVRANFSACPQTSYEYIDAEVQVANLVSLSVTHDPNFLALNDPPLPLAVGTAEAFVVTGLLDDPGAHTQDLSYQALLETNTGNLGILSFAGNVGVALDNGAAQVTASFGTITSQVALTVQTQDANLIGYKLSPADPTTPGATVPGAPNDLNQFISYQGFHSFHALGTFSTDTLPVTTFVQDLTNSTQWTSSSPADVAIYNAGELVGVAISARSKQTCVTIQGTLIANNEYKDSTSLGVGAPVANTTCP